jgi:ABC-2 type transport system ATP-binding protein
LIVYNTGMKAPILTVSNLRKTLGKTEILHGISFDVPAGSITALVGPNGAGKSTTLKIISTLLQPTSGTVQVNGHDVATMAAAVREQISYLPEESGAYKNMTGLAYLHFVAALYSSDAQQRAAYIERAIGIANLGPALTRKASTYSKGMVRKLLIGRAIMTNPALLILDEPTSGLDLTNAREIRKIIKELASTGTAILLSSHNMLEIEYLSDTIILINDGRIHDIGTAQELRKQYKADNIEDVFFAATHPKE